uniref:Small ribosomal subunit protein uS19c n=1 Tax=Goniomonas avonlea TaxID=1255295 RepID=A0A348G6L8_9CRYP|nr:ribosomal protein S19 [Goniomonas avonlea]
MARSLWKGPFIAHGIIKKTIFENYTQKNLVIKSYSRRSVILPQWVGFLFEVYNGRKFVSFVITEHMVHHKLGEFASTRKSALYVKT